jgi:two-component system phosphate regulon sensor histidine kinase PhoR
MMSNITLQNESQKRILEQAYHELQIQLQAAIAHAENLFLELPENSPLKAQAEDLLGSIESASMVLHNLTRGRYLPVDYRYVLCDVSKLVWYAVKLCNNLARAKSVQFKIDIKDTHDGTHLIAASKEHLQIALNNLLQNAVKYSYRGTAQSPRYISIEGRLKENGYEIRIQNYGVGIAADEYEKIFQDGYKGKYTRMEYRTGAGLGLGITKDIIERHCGRIHVESQPTSQMIGDKSIPHLTTIEIWLPIYQSEVK